MLQAVIGRLKTLPALKSVETAVDLAAIEQAPSAQTPAAYVIPIAESAAPNAMVGAVSQEVATRIGVVLVVRRAADARGVAGP